MADKRGGPRQSAPGAKTPNRTDMLTPNPQAAQAPRGQTYGQAGQQLAGQQIVPVAGSPTPSPGASTGGPQPAGLGPGEVPSMGDPTANPNQPVQAGLPSGPGPGPEALQTASFGPPELSVLRGLYLQDPNNEDLRRLIEHTEQNLA